MSANGNIHHEHEKIVSKDAKMNFGFRHWMVIVMGFLALFFTGSVQNESLNVVIPKLTEIHGWSDATISMTSTVATIIGALFVLIWGQLTERFGSKKFAILALLLAIVGFASTGLVTNLPEYIIFRIVTVIGTLSTMNYFVAIIATNWFPTKKGIAMGYITVGNNAASLAALWILNFLWDATGFAIGSIAYAALGLIPVLILVVLIPEYPEQCGCYPDNDTSMTREQANALLEEGRRYEKESPWTLGRLLRAPQVWKLGVSLGVLCLCISGILTHLVAIFVDRGFTETQGMLGMSIVSALAIPLSILLGVLDARKGARFACIVLAIVMAVCYFMALVPAWWSVIFAALAAAAVMGCLNNMATSLPASIFGRYDMKRAQSVILPIMQVLQAAGVGMTGVVATVTGGFTAVLAIMGICSIVAILILLTLKDECIGRVE